ncbi:MAG: hypothetical protein ACK5MN_00500 [Lachnospiraceae bacterium]
MKKARIEGYMFLNEKMLREAFWKCYNYKKRAIRCFTEVDLTHGRVDLMTLEVYKDNYQINSFEFKIADIKKGILKACANKQFSSKSWLVLPKEKQELINSKYQEDLKRNGIGVLLVADDGRWEAVLKPNYRKIVVLDQKTLNVLSEMVVR